ncbi:hypothetical protein GmHk_04G010765 [Glycine max]|nr:hypothetical protein GmHk_04G010765 [Glycine max]
MSEIEEVQELMKVDMEAIKGQMSTMMEAMMSMRKMMEVNAAIVVAASTTTEVDPTHPLGFNQVNHPASDMVGQGGKELGSADDPNFVQVQNKHGLPPNYTPPNVAHTPNENVDNSAPMPIESQQPQSNHAHVSQPMGETHEAPLNRNLDDFEPHLRCATEGQAVGGVPLPNTLEGPQFCPQPQPLHFAVGRVPPAKEYAQRWRDLAAQVALPMMEREMITMIVDMLPVFYYEKMVGYTPSSFADLVFVGERIEEGETHVEIVVPTWPNFPPDQQYQYSANISPSQYPPPYQPRTLNHPQRPPLNHPIPNTTLNTNQNTNRGRNFPEKKPVDFTPILVSYANLLPYLLNNAMVAITSTKVPQPPFFRGYNSDATCAYHGGVSGHSIEHCKTLKHKVMTKDGNGYLSALHWGNERHHA